VTLRPGRQRLVRRHEVSANQAAAANELYRFRFPGLVDAAHPDVRSTQTRSVSREVIWLVL
jgi:hypothetical protein